MPVNRLRDLKTNHLKCRSFMHPWDIEYTTIIRVDRKRTYESHLRCPRCKGTKVIYVAVATGERNVKAPKYDYPKDYVVEDLKSWGGRSELNANVIRELMLRSMKP